MFDRMWPPLRAAAAAAAAMAVALVAAGAASGASGDPRPASAPAQRIVTIGGAVTEIAYALGQQDRIVGVDATSAYPAEAASKPNVGYMRALSPEGVLALRPDLIVAVEGSGPPGAVDILRSASVPFVMVPDGRSLEGIDRKIELVAEALDVPEAGRALAAAVHDDLEAVLATTGAVPRRKRVLFVMSLTDGRPLGAGRDTAADAIIALAGAENALRGVSGYKPVSPEAIAATAPDVVLAMRRSDGVELDPDLLFATPALKFTPAARDRALIVMDGLYLLGFGPRTASAVRDLAERLYPGLDLPRGHAGR